jgi:hypothetical protein
VDAHVLHQVSASITFPEPPARFRRAVAKRHRGHRGRVHQPVHQISVRQLTLRRTDQHSTLVRPHRVYTIDTRDLLKRAPLSAASSTGWHSLDLTDDGELTSRTVGLHPETNRPAVVGMNAGWLAKEVVASWPLVKAHGSTSELEFRFLILAPIHTAAIWLHGRRDDFIMPLAPCGVPLPPGKLYSAKQFFTAAKGIASHMLVAAGLWRAQENGAARMAEARDRRSDQHEPVKSSPRRQPARRARLRSRRTKRPE